MAHAIEQTLKISNIESTISKVLDSSHYSILKSDISRDTQSQSQTQRNTQRLLSKVNCHFLYSQQVPLNNSLPSTHKVSKLLEGKRVLFSLVHQADSI